jgi:hypothetical protein
VRPKKKGPFEGAFRDLALDGFQPRWATVT